MIPLLHLPVTESEYVYVYVPLFKSVIVPCIAVARVFAAPLSTIQRYELVLVHWLVIITKKVSPPVVIRFPPESFAVTVTVAVVPAAMFWMPLPLTTEVVGLATAKAR